MQRARRIVAAALGGGALTTLTVAALALGAGNTTDATVTLQVAPRGPGTVSAEPIGGGGDHPCVEQEGSADCRWSYERGTTVRLTAAADGPDKSFFGWSDQECGTDNPCTVKLDDDLTSIVAVFSPLMLGVKFSNNDGGATVSANPAGQPCALDDLNDAAVFCSAYPPHTRVALTVKPGTTPFRSWKENGDYLCEPRNATTCTIAVEDQPTWAGARFADDAEPQPPTTITVEFKLRKSGNGSGRVTASRLDCGTVCTANFGFGRAIALTANPDDGSLFDGWNGVCARTQLTCTFPAGPITSIRAAFTRDATAPTAPGVPVIGSRTRSSIAISWGASTDNVRVAGYRVYLNDAPAGETQAPAYTLEGLKCGRSYAVAVDAVDGLGNRSPRASVTTQTRPCALAARLAGVGVGRVGGIRAVVAVVRVNRATSARLRLLRGRRAVLTARFAVKPGTNRLRLRVPRRIPGGAYRLATTLVNPDGGALVLPGRGVLLPRP
jgi:fibronectin type III domain protein/List-Bact-rpt repeat protein